MHSFSSPNLVAYTAVSECTIAGTSHAEARSQWNCNKVSLVSCHLFRFCVVCVIHFFSTKNNLLCSTGLTTAPSIYGVPSMVAPPLVQGGFPPVAGLAGAGIIPGVIPAAIDPVGVPSECLLLKNMFDPSTEVGDLLIIFSSLNRLHLKLMLLYICVLFCRLNLNLTWTLKKMLQKNAPNSETWNISLLTSESRRPLSIFLYFHRLDLWHYLFC